LDDLFPPHLNPLPPGERRFFSQEVVETMRRSNLFLIFLAANIFLLGLMFAHASFRMREEVPSLQEKAEMVKRLGLTDLCLFTEASYTRHLSQADLHTAFQDSPMSLEHFPSGSLAAPPPGLRKINGKMD
jgi:hypothetical protein